MRREARLKRLEARCVIDEAFPAILTPCAKGWHFAGYAQRYKARTTPTVVEFCAAFPMANPIILNDVVRRSQENERNMRDERYLP